MGTSEPTERAKPVEIKVEVKIPKKHDPDLQFYEEELEEDSYDRDLISEMFDRVKFRFNKNSYDNFSANVPLFTGSTSKIKDD